MNSFHSLQKFLVAGALALGLSVSVFAGGDDMSADSPSLVGQGLLGQTYYNASYSFLNLDDTSADAHALTFEYNRAVDGHLDTFASARFLRTDSLPGGGRVRESGLNFGARFFTNYNGFKPYWDAAIGWTWGKFGSFKDNTFTWSTAVGAEFAVASGLTLTPYLQYADAIDFVEGDSWNVGVKGNYWLNARTAVLANIERQIDESWEYRLGVNFRF